MISEEQKKKYEEKAWEHFPDVHPDESWHTERQIFIGGCEHAHDTAHSEGYKEGINETIDQVEIIISLVLSLQGETHSTLFKELQKLRK